MSRRVDERVREGVGVSVPRIDGVPKVKGQFSFGSDLWADEMLWGHTVRSPHPSARIRALDISGAVASRGLMPRYSRLSAPSSLRVSSLVRLEAMSSVLEGKSMP